LTLCLVCFALSLSSASQERVREPSIGIFAGTINYQGDLKPNSFTFQRSNPVFGVIFRKPLNRWLTWRSGISFGKVEGADRFNRDYLQTRNLSFYSSITEIYTSIAVTILDISTKRFTPYLYGGIGVFHFNPWTYDVQGNKIHLKPLSTEGQGLAVYPGQKPYSLNELMVPIGAGIKFAVSDHIHVGIEFSQRKTFTDYLDDVSTHYVDQDVLLAAKGPKAVELAYRGNELPGGSAYPPNGEQRGTATEMDWYYFLGVTLEMKLSGFQNIFSGIANQNRSSVQKCPRF
jgi:opacity protein-like surface antigen